MDCGNICFLPPPGGAGGEAPIPVLGKSDAGCLIYPGSLEVNEAQVDREMVVDHREKCYDAPGTKMR
jgi:hypothetical protein